MIIAFISNPLNFFPLFALGEKRNSLIVVINTSKYPNKICKYLNIKRNFFRSKIICLPFFLSRGIMKSKILLKTLFYINNLIQKQKGIDLISIAVPTLIEKPLSFLYDEVLTLFKNTKIYEFGDFIGVRCTYSSLNKDHIAFKEQNSLLLNRKRKLNSQIINSSLFEKEHRSKKLNISCKGKNYINSINKFIKKNQELDHFLENHVFKQTIKENKNIYILVLRSVGRNQNQSIFKKDQLINIKRNAQVIIRPHPRDSISKSKFIKLKLKQELNKLKIMLNELEIKNITFDNYSFVPIELLILHAFHNNYFINVIGKESGIVLNEN